MNRFSTLHTRFSAVATVAACAGATLLFSAQAGAAEPAPLLHGDTIAITAYDLQADALRIPPEVRPTVLSKPQTVVQIAGNLYARRAMANLAEADGLAGDPVVRAALQLARDKVLSDALLAKIDSQSSPSDAIAEGLARNIYKAKPERFQAGEQVRVRHILVAGKESDSRAQAEKILEDLKGGADFAALAQERSADKGSASKGGELGWFERGRMVPEFDEAAFALQKPNDLSGVIETQFGFHVLQLQERKLAGKRPFEEVRDELVKEVRASVQQDARVAQAQKLQQGATIDEAAIAAFASGYSTDNAGKPAQ